MEPRARASSRRGRRLNIVDRLTQQLADNGVIAPREAAIRKLTEYGILDSEGNLTPYGQTRNAMTPEERAIDRASRRSGHAPEEYQYDPDTNRATLMRVGR